VSLAIQALDYVVKVCAAAHKANPALLFEVFIHKVDGDAYLHEDHKVECQQDIQQQLQDELADQQLDVRLFARLLLIFAFLLRRHFLLFRRLPPCRQYVFHLELCHFRNTPGALVVLPHQHLRPFHL
jgi:hypothetical protein